jgi:hypothetical protein
VLLSSPSITVSWPSQCLRRRELEGA